MSPIDPPPAAAANPLKDFLTPEAMLTPGVLGSMTMMITNALASNFSMPRAGLALGLSFIFGLLVLVAAKAFVQKAVFYVLNSLVIFCMALGANVAGEHSTKTAAALLGPSTAYAGDLPVPRGKVERDLTQCNNISASVQAAQKRGASDAEILDLIMPCQNLSQNVSKALGDEPASLAIQKSDRFFAPWSFSR